jgi:ethanolamine ammonia-lyase small subunit
VGVKEDVVQVILASYLQDVDLDILQGDGLDSAAFANNLKGISI